MTGSTQLVGSGSDDGAGPLTNIGFNFNYGGVQYTQFSANVNGVIRLGALTDTSFTFYSNSLSNAGAGAPLIMPYWDDLATGTNGKVHYVVTGTAPNRVLKIEWIVTVPYNVNASAGAKFQCWMWEYTNEIHFIYGAGMADNPIGTNNGYTVGVSASSTVYKTVNTSTHTSANNTFTMNSAAITSGRMYTFAPTRFCPAGLGATATTISSLPYSISGQSTCGAGNNVTSANVPVAVGDIRYYTGEDRTYTFTPTSTGTHNILLTTAADDDAGLVLYQGCPYTAGSTAVAFSQNATTLTRTLTPSLTAGITYYLVVDNWVAPPCISSYSLSITPPPCDAPTALAGTATSSSTANLSWTSPASAPSNGYQWEVRTSGAGGSGSVGLAANGSTAAGVISASVTALSANTTYSIYVRSNCGNFSGWIQSANPFTTPPPVLPGCPATVQPANAATNVNINSSLSWAAGSNATSYNVYFGTSATPPLVLSGTTALTYNPGVLAANTAYNWKVVAVNSVGSTDCATRYFVTSSMLPGCPTTYTPSNGTTNVSGNTSLSWTAGSTATSYDVYFGTSSPPPLVLSNTTALTYTPASISPNTTYYWKINAKNSFGTTNCVSNSFVTGSSGFHHCIPTNTSICGAGDHITNTTFTTINNNSGTCISLSYSDYRSGTSASVVTAGSYPISVSVNNGGPESAAAWIDWNQNGVFDASEFITLTDANNAAPWIFTGTVNVPSGATVGSTVLRVRSAFNYTIPANSACSTYGGGEIEDYTVNVASCLTTWYSDADHDGFGDHAVSVSSCVQPIGFVSNNSDCYPSIATYSDADGDGFGSQTAFPCGGVTNSSDCNDGAFTYADTDGDGFGSGPRTACGATNNTDCNPTAFTYADTDGDGFGAGAPAACGVTNNTDCNNTNANVYPTNNELPGNGLDDNCNGQIDEELFLVPYSGSNEVACGSTTTLADHGGNDEYYNSANGYTVLNNINAVITLSGTYDVEANYDYVRIWDGVGTNGQLLASYSGTGSINFTSAADQTLTIQFIADHNAVQSGFNIAVSYTGSCEYSVPFSGSNSFVCGSNRTIYDHGGSTGNYANNANGTTVFQNAGSGIVTLTGIYSVEADQDFIKIYSGTAPNQTLIGSYTGSGSIASISSPPGVPLTVVFTSNASVTSTGFSLQASFSGSCTGCNGAPTPGNTISNSTTACTGTQINLSLQNATSGDNVGYQWQQSSSQGGTYTNIAGATGATYSPTITADTWFRANLTCSGSTTVSVPIAITVTSGVACYCAAYSPGGCQFNLLVNHITLNTLDNDSGPDCGDNGYSNYSVNPALTTILLAGVQYDMTVTSGTYEAGVAAWIDFNDDGIFSEPSERVTSSSEIIVNGVPGNFPVTIPCTATNGQHRMRIRLEYNTPGPAISPCGTAGFGYGEVEDYTITIQSSAIAISATAANNPICTGSTTLLTANTTAPVSWFTGTGGTGTNLGTGATLVAGPGTYYAYVAGDCGTAEASVTVDALPNVTYYADTDNDTFGDPGAPLSSCTGAPAGYVTDNSDCNDSNIQVHTKYSFYTDADGDGYGTGTTSLQCAVDANTPPFGYATNNTDCDDNNIIAWQTVTL